MEMTVPRQKTDASIETKMDALKRKISRVKKLHEELCKELIVLGAQREEAMAREVLVAMKKSGKSYNELMIFLQKP